VLAQAIYREGAKNVAAGANPMDVKRGIEKAVERATVRLRRNGPYLLKDRGQPNVADYGITRHIVCALYLSRCALMNSYDERTRPVLGFVDIGFGLRCFGC
jgi:hypothetical protein